MALQVDSRVHFCNTCYTMARTAEFDRDQVLQQAMELFWRQGYRNTSIRDLTEATGIGESSLYNAFGDKRALYCETLDLFFEMLMRVWKHETKDQSPLDGLRSFWYWMCDDAAGKHSGLGCMVVNTAVEVAPHDPEIRKMIRTIYAKIEMLMTGLLKQAQAEGELSPDKNVEAIARFLTHSTQGIRVMAKIRPTKTYMRDVAEQTLSVLN